MRRSTATCARHLAHRRPVEDRRLSARTPRQRAARVRGHTRGCLQPDPSAELAANQFDPFDYAVVAPLVGEMVERRRSPADLLALFEKRALDPDRFLPDANGRTVYDKHTPETFRRVLDDTASRLRRSVYKRLQGPPIVVVSERAFGFDLRETIINGWTGRWKSGYSSRARGNGAHGWLRPRRHGAETAGDARRGLSRCSRLARLRRPTAGVRSSCSWSASVRLRAAPLPPR